MYTLQVCDYHEEKNTRCLLAFSRNAFKWPNLFPLNQPRRFLKLCPCFAILAERLRDLASQ